MNRILATGDFHICERFDLAQVERLLNVVADEANKRDGLWILGDIFHLSNVTPGELKLFCSFIRKVKVPIEIIGGNHDSDGENSLVEWIGIAFPEVQISVKSITKEVDGVKILMGHFNVDESVLGAYDYKLVSGIKADDLDVDLALLGHIHKSQNIQGKRAQVVHPGSLFYISYDERNDTKCMVDLTLDSGKYYINRIPLKPDPIAQIDLMVGDDYSKLLDVPKESRVKLIMHYTDPTLDKKSVIKSLDKYHFKDKKITFFYDVDKAVSRDDVVAETRSTLSLAEFLEQKAPQALRDLIMKYLSKEIK